MATQSGDYKPASGQKIKGRAPQPPKQTPIAHDINEHKAISMLEMQSDQNVLTMKGNLIKTTLDILVIFPNGEEQKIAVPGSKPVMDLFVDLCSQYHLNPAHYTFELMSGETQQSLSYKPNTLIGTLDVQKVLLKFKVPEEKKIKRPPPKIPEKTVRLVVNYLKTQKTVVRVSPEVPLQSIIPIISEKCEVSQESIVLLRDIVTGEKLELTKSLNDLGIKELYAWNNEKAVPAKTQSEPTVNVNYRETKTSTGCDTSVKEKKGFFGFFRTNKENKAKIAPRRSLDMGVGEFFKSILYRKQSLDETVRVDSSRNECFEIVAPSLSLGNVRGTTSSIEMKKRRAPPIPVSPPSSGGEDDKEEKIPTPMSQSSLQLEVKKPKRRAPPPPIPKRPNRLEEMKRESAIRMDRLPQKPPRGNTRDPPQLVIPPPPSYPPPDKDTMDPAALYNEADVTDPTQLVSKRKVQLLNTYKEDTVEETNPFRSCSMPECNIDDSKIINLPPVIVPLAFQNDGINSTDKSIDVEKTSAEIDSVLVAEECSVNKSSFKNNTSENIKQRADGRMMEAKTENTDMFMVAGIQKFQLALDKSLAVTENIHNDLKSQSVVFEMKGASSPPLQKAENPSDVSSPVPVTIIDEVPENYIVAHSNTEGQTSENVPVKFTDLVKFFDRNINIESLECVQTSSCSPKNLLQKCSTENTYENISDELTKSHLELKGASAKHPDEEEFPWRGIISNRSKIYRSKTGLTTFTVVPPKPKIRDFNRNQSLYMSALQIDDLGNLVKPNNSCTRKDATSKVTGFDRGKEYKTSNAVEKQTEGLSLDHSVEAEYSIKSRQPNKMFSTKPDCIRSLKTETWPTVTAGNENIVGPDETKDLSNTSQFSGETVLAIGREDIMFHMPSKQSSNDYLTTTVVNSNDITQFEIIQEKQYEELNETERMKTEMEPISKICTVAAKYCPVETEPAKTKELYSTTFSCSKNVSNTTALCADPRVSNIKALKQNKSVNTIHGIFTTMALGQIEEELAYNLIQDVTDREMTFAVIKKPPDQVSSPFFLSKPNADSSATIFSSHVKSSNIPSIAMVNQITEKYENLGKAESKLYPNRLEDNIYDTFGPKKKFKSDIQMPPPNDTSLHSALMEATQNAGGEDKLRKISCSTISGSPKESKCMETDTGRSALLAAIRRHSGISTLRKISSFASDELQRFRNAVTFKKASPPPPLPFPGNSRQVLMIALREAIDSGAAKARLRKVPQCEKSYDSEAL